MGWLRPLSLLAIASLIGCTTNHPVNPSFPLSLDEAERLIDEMGRAPVRLARPVVVANGYLDPGISEAFLIPPLKGVAVNAKVLGVAFPLDEDFDACRQRLIAEVDRAFPTDDPEATIEVDVIGVSMGGVAARYAALPAAPGEQRRRLRIARLFTIGSPHRGADLATLPTWRRIQLDMRSDSQFLARLNAGLGAADYKLYPYVCLGDEVVGEANAAPPGVAAWWVHPRALRSPHLGAVADPRIQADIFRRLRGEPPLTASPPSPLPPAAR